MSSDSPLTAIASGEFGWVFTIVIAPIALLLAPLFVLGLIGLQARNPDSARTWRRPTWTSNPFDLRNPMAWLHACACIAAAMSFGVVLGGLIAWQPSGWVGAWLAILAAELFWSVWLCERRYKRKFDPLPQGAA